MKNKNTFTLTWNFIDERLKSQNPVIQSVQGGNYQGSPKGSINKVWAA